MSDREARVRARAHQLWEQEGRPHGRDADHWAQASREVDAEGTAPAKKKAPRARKTAAKSAEGGGPKPARKKRASKKAPAA